MTTIRKAYSAPSYTVYENENEIALLVHEIKKMQPRVEITLENFPEVAKGRITEWHEGRKFFTVKWDEKSEAFDKKIESSSGLRAFFKGKLFSAQILFKSTTVRRLTDELYHYRIPDQIYKQQRRAALRVPLAPSAAKLVTPRGEFSLLDLSVSGAKLRSNRKKIPPEYFNVILENCALYFGKRKIDHSDFSVRISRVEADFVGVKFQGLSKRDQMAIKQFLMESLRTFYKDTL